MINFAKEAANTLIDLSCLGLLKIEGEDAKQFLQGQLTCNLEDISTTQSRLGAHCNPQGRILSLSRIFYYKQAYYFQLPKDTLFSALTALQKYAVFFKVKITDATNELGRMSFSGLLATEKLSAILNTLPIEIDSAIQSATLLIIKLPGLVSHYQIIGDIATITTLSEKLQTLPNAQVGNENDWKYLCISAGIPSIYAQTETKLLPHEINLHLINGISFNKGCYTGQEIIARMQYRGQLKKHLYYASVTSDIYPKPGDDIYADESCGIIVDSCHYEENTYHVLIVANETDVQTKSLFIDNKKQQLLEFIKLPYSIKTR